MKGLIFMSTFDSKDTIDLNASVMDVLATQKIPSPLTIKDLTKLGQVVLAEKRLQVENENAGLNFRMMKKIPDKLTFDEIATILVSQLSFANIKTNEDGDVAQLGLYHHNKNHPKFGLYSTQMTDMSRMMRAVCPSLSIQGKKEIIDLIQDMVPTVTRESSPHLVAVNNGIFNKESQELEPFTHDRVFVSKLAINYKQNPVNPIIVADDGFKWDVESWLLDIANDDNDIKTLFWQVFSDAIHGSYSRGKSIFFYSQQGNNGKGTIGQLIKNLLGKGNYSTLPINDFNHEFKLSNLVGAIANIADENDVDQYIDSVRDFKASITGDDIIINGKFEKPFPYKFNGANIQMLNGLPKTRDKSDSFYRRLILVPFAKSFTNNGERTYIKNDYINIPEVLEYVLHKALHLKFDEYIQPNATKSILAEYKETNNPVLQYWNEMSSQFVWDVVPTQFLYDLFISWYKRNNPNGKPLSKNSFIDSMRTVLTTSTTWKESFSGPTTVGDRMKADEPLITEYSLENWYDPKSITSKNLVKLRAFTRKTAYRGIVRH